jgi:hypothetical protein
MLSAKYNSSYQASKRILFLNILFPILQADDFSIRAVVIPEPEGVGFDDFFILGSTIKNPAPAE